MNERRPLTLEQIARELRSAVQDYVAMKAKHQDSLAEAFYWKAVAFAHVLGVDGTDLDSMIELEKRRAAA